MREIIRKRLDETMAKLDGGNTLMVLKGVSLEDIDIEKAKMDSILENKMSYLFSLNTRDRKIITYDEFLGVSALLLEMFSKIYVIDNNIYLNYYPLVVDISDRKIDSLIKHFDEDLDNSDFELEDISELTNIYGNMKEINNHHYAVYNDIMTHEKIEYLKLWQYDGQDPLKEDYQFDADDKIYEIIDELDYVKIIDDIMNNNQKQVNIINDISMTEKHSILERINYLNIYFRTKLNIRIGALSEGKKAEVDYSEYLEILKKYWNKDGFLNIKNYDLNALQREEKRLIDVSQGEIISTIVKQAENCMENKAFKDVFVTAPTGSGKSAMFQIPAMYLSEKHGVLTIVISPLIGLMKDQVKNLEVKNYSFSRTINSDISPIKKQEIIDDIAEGRCNILYISPETLLSRSDVEQLIGDRKIGLFVIDEAHIVTTWGKQFRPDYWFLGEHVKKMKKAQEKKKGSSFPIATFTATAIYGGMENMYNETKQGLNMIKPHTYLGYVKRDDITIRIEKSEKRTNRTEYELEKFEQMIDQINRARITNKKMLIYFPTVALINRFYEYCYAKGLSKVVAKYHGQMKKQEKEENYESFYNKEKLVMLATKAFGMGIDIDDIEIVEHFAPTGNVCDYVQEIGRAARNRDLEGEAYYNYMSNDFKHINRLHGLSIVKEYQLIEVIKKIHELFVQKLKHGKDHRFTRKRNEMLIDAESFSHIFETTFFNEDDAINKVKTAMLIIQKDFENKRGFSPFHIRPIPLFSMGYFKVRKTIQDQINAKYYNALNVLSSEEEICSINLNKIWEEDFSHKYSFPQFKYLIYTKNEELKFKFKDELNPALVLDIYFENNHGDIYSKYFNTISEIFYTAARSDKYYGVNDLAEMLVDKIKISSYNARTIMDIIVTTITFFARDFAKLLNGKIYSAKPLINGDVKYRFNASIERYFDWISKGYKFIESNTKDEKLYLVDNASNRKYKEYLMLLGILEILGVLSFKATGGSNSQIYIYVNETKTMKQIIERPYNYKNKLLETVRERHNISVAMLTFLFENDFSSDEIWGYIEDYFLGIIPEEVKKLYKKKYGEELQFEKGIV